MKSIHFTIEKGMWQGAVNYLSAYYDIDGLIPAAVTEKCIDLNDEEQLKTYVQSIWAGMIVDLSDNRENEGDRESHEITPEDVIEYIKASLAELER